MDAQWLSDGDEELQMGMSPADEFTEDVENGENRSGKQSSP
jgi:hypothetical protein